MPNFFVAVHRASDIVGRIKCPAYLGCGDTPTRNTNLVNLTTELEMLICVCVCVCVCVFILLVGGL